MRGMTMRQGAAALVLALWAMPTLAQPAGGAADAERSVLRLACDGDSAGAEVLINGVFKGECPVDVTVGAGSLRIEAVQGVDALQERSYTTEIRMAGGTAKRIEIVLGPVRLNAAGRREAEARAEVERQAEAQQRAARQRQAEELAASQAQKEQERQQRWMRLNTAAAAGDPEALLALAQAYEDGTGVPRSTEQALAWYRRAAAAGQTDAMVRLGRVSETAEWGVPRNGDEALAWYLKAAEAGNPEGMYHVGDYKSHLPLGLFGRAQKEQEIFDWFRKAADAGQADAMLRLYSYLLFGIEPATQDAAGAARLLRDAAAKGQPRALFLQGLQWVEARDPQLRTQGLDLLHQSARKGEPGARDWLRNAGLFFE